MDQCWGRAKRHKEATSNGRTPTSERISPDIRACARVDRVHIAFSRHLPGRVCSYWYCGSARIGLARGSAAQGWGREIDTRRRRKQPGVERVAIIATRSRRNVVSWQTPAAAWLGGLWAHHTQCLAMQPGLAGEGGRSKASLSSIARPSRPSGLSARSTWLVSVILALAAGWTEWSPERDSSTPAFAALLSHPYFLSRALPRFLNSSCPATSSYAPYPDPHPSLVVLPSRCSAVSIAPLHYRSLPYAHPLRSFPSLRYP